MRTTVLREIFAFLFGYRYYINVVNAINTPYVDASSFIFPTKEQAMKHMEELKRYNKSFEYVTTLTCYSRKIFTFDGKHNYIIEK